MSVPARLLAVALAALALPSAGALAQRLPVGATVTSGSITAYTQLDADIDGGGDFHGSGVFAIGSVLRQFTPELTAGFTLRYDYEDWKFSSPAAFGAAPWGQLHRPSIGATFVYAADAGLTFTAIPTIQCPSKATISPAGSKYG